MYPRSEEVLSVSKVLDHWSRSGPDGPDPDALLTELLRAFWCDDLRLLQPGGTGTASREVLLEGLRVLDGTGGVIFVRSKTDIPPDVIYRSDGSAEADLAHYVVLPASPRELSRKDLEAACKAVADVPASDYAPEFLTIFRCHLVQREHLGRLCDVRGWRRPSFWFRSAAARPTTKDRRLDTHSCREWLIKVFAGKRQAKRKLKAQVTQLFPNVRTTDFQKLWDELAPSPWRRPGAIGDEHTGAPRRRRQT